MQSELLVCADWHKLEAKKLRELATMHEDQCDCIRMMADNLSMQADVGLSERGSR